MFYYSSGHQVHVFPHTTKHFSDMSWVSHNSTKFWHYLSEDSIRCHRLRAWFYKTASPTSYNSQVQVVTYVSDQLTIDLEIPMTPMLGLINLLECLTQLREIFYLVDYKFITKGRNSGSATWKRCIRQLSTPRQSKRTLQSTCFHHLVLRVHHFPCWYIP